MRELQLVFQSKGKDDYIITAYDIDRTSFDGVGVKYREVKPVNIQPKGITTLRLFNDVNINDYDFTDIKRIYIQYRNEKNKVKRMVKQIRKTRNLIIKQKINLKRNNANSKAPSIKIRSKAVAKCQKSKMLISQIIKLPMKNLKKIIKRTAVMEKLNHR
jgi:hypothetical protein